MKLGQLRSLARLPYEYGEGPPSPYIEAGHPLPVGPSPARHTGRVPPPPTLKQDGADGLERLPVYGEGPPSPYIEATAAACHQEAHREYGEGPPSPYIEAGSAISRTGPAANIRGGSPLPLH